MPPFDPQSLGSTAATLAGERSDIGPELESRIVWLFGSPRSGSTWLLQMPVAPADPLMNEPTIGFHLSPFLSNEPGYRAEDLDLGTFTLRRAMRDDPERFFARAFADVWLPGLRRMLNERFELTWRGWRAPRTTSSWSRSRTDRSRRT